MSHAGRRFPPPWTPVEHAESYSVRDATGFPVCWLYFTDRPDDTLHGQRLTRDQARRLAANIARLPGLLGAGTGEGG